MKKYESKNLIFFNTSFLTYFPKWKNILKQKLQKNCTLIVTLIIKSDFLPQASLMAYSCKAVAILGNQDAGDPAIEDIAYKYGQNIGIAFQLVDDWLDFVASADQLGEDDWFARMYGTKLCQQS